MSGARQWRRRSEAAYGPETGTTYLLHFDEPYQHARHYTGWTRDLPARLEEHWRGQGARLMQAVRAAGIGFTLARIWEGTTRDREDSLKHRGSARRFCPQCGVKPASPRLESGRPQLAAADRSEVPEDVPEYDFADWPDLTARMSRREAAELAAALRRGALAAYDAAGRSWPDLTDYLARFDTAIEADRAAQKAARETAQFHGREPGQPVDEWITQARQARQEEEMFKSKARADRRQQAEADRLFALADELAKQEGKRPDYQREITAERAARIMRELGEPLAREAATDGPELAGEDLDREIERLAGKYPEYGPDEFVQRADCRDPRIVPWGNPEPEPDAQRTAPDHLYSSPECAEADPETAHFGWSQPEPEDAGRLPLPRVLDTSEVSPALAPVAATLRDGTPHADPFLAGRGWQAQHGRYVRQPQAQPEAG